MPQIIPKHVVSVSSEDKNFPADNLLKGDSFKKWKAKPGDKTASVILQFPKAEKIHQIDVGNENSAFVEVLVGTSTARGDDFKVIVVASSFMSPMEARNSQNGNRVRMFTSDKLSQAVSGDKWDRVKVVCSQQFNKTIPFGLSFIKFHGTPGEGEELPKEEKPVKLGAFAIKSDSDSGDSLKPGSLFAKKDKLEEPPLQGAAAMRAASKLVEQKASTSSPSSSAPAKRKHEDDVKSPSEKPPLKKQSTSLSSVASHASSHSSAPPLKKSKTEPSKTSKEKAFSDLLKDVVFVLSGYQNPERGKIRDKAMEMGATYKPDWGKGCTHLICAFENTPKFAEVKGKGRIVSKDWVKDTYRSKTRQPWRKYRVGRAPSPAATSSESEDEASPVKRKSPPAKKKSPAKDKYAGSTDSEVDTEDELRKIKEKNGASTKAAGGDSVYDAPTDEDVSDGEGELPPLPDFFKDKTFFMYGKWEADQRRKVKRYVIAYNGVLADYMSEKVTHVLTDNSWDDNFDDALTNNPNLHFVKPTWIHACYDKQKLLPHQKFVVVPN